ncbi:flagellar rod assembly protein/muramidase FlgJ [Planctomycetes bacterium MalM25]|nr:flagellar rod assembly protein/muramidase FlgJ [Planctomycetes bacterium MalM25]
MISPVNPTQASDLSPVSKPASLQGAPATRGESAVAQARELKEAFGQFVGETFFSQMLKSMRSTVNEPAYFHGGHAEEQFQARLDQQVSQDLAASGGEFAEDLFESSFPREAALLKRNETNTGSVESPLAALDMLRRR